MFTEFYYKCLVGSLFPDDVKKIPYKNPIGSDKTTVHDSLEFIRSLKTALRTPITVKKATTSYYCGVAFGDGDTPVRKDDYCLSGEHITGFSFSYVGSLEEEYTQSKITYTITNGGAESVTIKEIGVFSCSSSSQAYSALVYREVLDSPVTIAPGGVGLVTLTIKANVPES